LEAPMIKNNSKDRKKEEKTLITFLKRTREGKYAQIDKSSLPYSRAKEHREPNYTDEEFFYSLR
jgi:hypothetical protein